ncbi:hypothetical protein BU26DRAFT_559189 [Trematosphaeria pertusa]|uniref:Uncharacterized protein n=1 Tax=Trematosphaeria pertusa TaxID=390896 RepID=A0A6A6IVQ2_9PLEO|nr:uncharacterized protein BU26DRAFT_559189 [Trematosphaeria pertusa]KAF2254509.1 hypothetical protein BU26DRAFT_559189 [Trematosphaeria pertusa]
MSEPGQEGYVSPEARKEVNDSITTAGSKNITIVNETGTSSQKKRLDAKKKKKEEEAKGGSGGGGST